MDDPLTLDGLTFEIRRSARRRSLEIVIERDGALTLHAPLSALRGALESFARQKRLWVQRKLAEKGARRSSSPPKEFVSGEGFFFHGRSHRLLLVSAQEVPLRLEGGRFRLLRAEAVEGRAHFVRWYAAQALPWLEACVRRWSPRVGASPAEVSVRDMGFRWGTCSGPGKVSFHWATIVLPATIAEYVVLHELVHLHEANHGPRFWARIARAMPDWEARKSWLAEQGGHHLVL